ncbi:MAG: hypothetical protein WC758_01185 [Candidatus Woesearchaeota archaeon]|jgi:hypothetical protein
MQINCALEGFYDPGEYDLRSDSHYNEQILVHGKKIFINRVDDVNEPDIMQLRNSIIDAIPYLILLQNHSIKSSYNFSTNIFFDQDSEQKLSWKVFDLLKSKDMTTHPQCAEDSLVNKLQVARNHNFEMKTSLFNLGEFAHAHYSERKPLPFMSGKTLSEAVQNLLTVYDFAPELRNLDIPIIKLHENYFKNNINTELTK